MGDAPAEVAPGVFRLGSALVNWYLVEGDDGRFTAVDAGLPGYARTLDADLRSLGNKDVSAVVLTHGHADHVGLVPRLAAAGASVHAHPGDGDLLREREEQKPELGLRRYVVRHRAARRFVLHFVRNGGLRVAGIDFAPAEDGSPLDVPGRPTPIHLPGHTRGHCAWHFPKHGALFVGDAIVTWNPYTGRTGPQIPSRASNADSEACMASLRRLAATPADVLCSGHGEPLAGPPDEVVARAEAAGFS